MRGELTPMSVAGILVSPAALVVIDLFRILADFEEAYDAEVLEDLEDRLAGRLGLDAACCVVSEALLLAYALRRPGCTFRHRAVGSRRVTPDEYRLYGLISFAGDRNYAAAAVCVQGLGIASPYMALSHAERIARHLIGAGVALDPVHRALLALPRSEAAVAQARRSGRSRVLDRA